MNGIDVHSMKPTENLNKMLKKNPKGITKATGTLSQYAEINKATACYLIQ